MGMLIDFNKPMEETAAALVLVVPLECPRLKPCVQDTVTGLCEGKSPVTGEFPSQRVSYAENVSIWRRHPANLIIS